MRILDEQNNELLPAQVNNQLGYLEVEKLFVKHHPKIEEKKEKSHYKVKRFLFTDNSEYIIEKENDPHIINIDAGHGLFGYKELDGESHKEIKSIEVELIID